MIHRYMYIHYRSTHKSHNALCPNLLFSAPHPVLTQGIFSVPQNKSQKFQSFIIRYNTWNNKPNID